MTVRARPLWLIRLGRELPRHLLLALAFAGVAASARMAIAPPRAVRLPAVSQTPTQPDRAAEAYAVLFARRYLTWSASAPQASADSLEAFLGQGVEAGAGLELPASGEQSVEWAEVVQAREPQRGQHVYTVAAQTDGAGLLYLTVGVTRTTTGALALTGYPAFVGAPAAQPARVARELREVQDQQLATVVERALRNYLASSSSELAADLASGARVSLPIMPMTLESVDRLDWAPGAGSVLATVQARDGRGVQYTLSYELDVGYDHGRWEISAVQTNPDAA